MDRKRIREVIVVEGRHDTDRLRMYYDCDTIETGGSSLSDMTMEMIRTAAKQRGIIVLTDPDSPGNRIRDRINREIPGCRNAFVDKRNARTEKKVGVEHADFETIDAALSNLITYTEQNKTISMPDMYELGLSGGENSSALREKAGRKLHIGNGNARTMLNRLNCLNITKEELKEILDE